MYLSPKNKLSSLLVIILGISSPFTSFFPYLWFLPTIIFQSCFFTYLCMVVSVSVWSVKYNLVIIYGFSLFWAHSILKCSTLFVVLLGNESLNLALMDVPYKPCTWSWSLYHVSRIHMHDSFGSDLFLCHISLYFSMLQLKLAKLQHYVNPQILWVWCDNGA